MKDPSQLAIKKKRFIFIHAASVECRNYNYFKTQVFLIYLFIKGTNLKCKTNLLL